MALFVNTNVAALNGQKNLMDVTSRMNSSFEKLSSGSRINSARDDAAGLQISDRLTTQITGLNQATRNANDGISIAQIAEGALGEVTNNIQRMRQLVVQGGNRTLSAQDRTSLAQEFEKLANVNNDIADRTAYGTLKILNGDSPEAGFQIQSGAYAGEQDTVTTGNAELTALLGKVLTDEVETDANYDSTLEFGDLDNTNLSQAGTMGKMIAAYAALTSTGDVASAIEMLFGANAAASTELLAAMGTNAVPASDVSLDVAAFADILEKEVIASAANTVGTGLDITTLSWMGIAATAVPAAGESWDDQSINEIHAFATDTLLDTMSNLITQVDKQRAKLGAEQNGLTSTVRNNTTAVVNVSDSRARIQDTDFAAETAELTRNQIIQQASTTILSQANQLPQTALSLLR